MPFAGSVLPKPGFAVKEIPHRKWGSIGSGSGIAAYKAELEKITGDEADGLIQMEVGRPGGHGQVMGQFLAMQVSELTPVPGISSHFHIGVVFADGWQMSTSDRDFFPPDGPPQQIRMPGLHRAGPTRNALDRPSFR